jgi:hypothetical protein
MKLLLPFHAVEQRREVPQSGTSSKTASERPPFLWFVSLHPKGHKGKQKKGTKNNINILKNLY